MSHEHDCPICYEALDIVSYTNMISTECGHRFHTTCLLKHTTFNGYGCPCCRTKLVENDNPYMFQTDVNPFEMDDRLNDTLQDSNYGDNDNDHDNDNEESSLQTESHIANGNIVERLHSRTRTPIPIELEDEDYRLDGLRWLFQQANEEPTDIITPYSEEYENWLHQYHKNEQEQNDILEQRMNKYIDTLEKIKSLDYNDFVLGFLYCMDDRFSSSSKAFRTNQKIFSTMIALRNRMNQSQTA